MAVRSPQIGLLNPPPVEARMARSVPTNTSSSLPFAFALNACGCPTGVPRLVQLRPRSRLSVTCPIGVAPTRVVASAQAASSSSGAAGSSCQERDWSELTRGPFAVVATRVAPSGVSARSRGAASMVAVCQVVPFLLTRSVPSNPARIPLRADSA